MVKWTKEQEEAIYSSGRDILVSAAAGSGKTAVLVERIIQKLINKDQPVNIDSLLVVTFTNAAAQEMRNRIASALEKALANDPTSHHLKKQLSLLQKASISTLHSFCMNIVREYAYLLDLDPQFRIATDVETDLIKQDTLDELFEEWYGEEGKNQELFFRVVECFSNDRSDVDVENLILSLYTFAMQHPWPDTWLDQIVKAYDIPDDWVESDLVWLPLLQQEVKEQLEAIKYEITEAMKLAQASDGPYHYIEAIEADLAQLLQAEEHLHSWTDLQQVMATSEFKRLSGKRIDCDEAKKESVKAIRDRYKDRWNNMKNTWFTRDLESHVHDVKQLYPVINHLVSLVKQFKDRYLAKKKEKAIVDFSDLEHFCLKLLVDETSKTERPQPSMIAQSLKQQYHEILIDEYQDTNLVQETILSLISDQTGRGNRFMVGDVKQSIYRFRHAEPTLFIQKYHQFKEDPHSGKRIDLASNFRSRELVLSGVNFIFRQILDETLGEIHYDRAAELIYGNKMYDELALTDPEPELVMIDLEEKEEALDDQEDYQYLKKAQLEARACAEKIKYWIGHEGQPPLQVVDKATQTLRDVQYRDIVILLRSLSHAETIVDELKKQGIPVHADLSTGYFEAIEIKIMISLLKIIDNPRQDIPLASVLRSPIVGLNEEELVAIRLADRKGMYYDAMMIYAEENPQDFKIQQFIQRLKRFKEVAKQGALSELIWQIYRETGFYDFVGGMPGGRQRQANLRALYDRARHYETTSFRGLFRFLRFIERMEERGDDLGAATALSEQEDVVRIMTIHKSKGLEFPIVILAGIDQTFNLKDLNQKYLLDKDYGFATKYIDPIKRITYPTLFYYALRHIKLRQQLAEEIRVLYVALTRAKEKLVMLGCVNSFAKKREKWQTILDCQDWVLPAYYRIEAKSYLDWIGPALIRHEQNEMLRDHDIEQTVPKEIRKDASKWKVSVIHASQLVHLDKIQDETDQELKQAITHWTPLPLSDQALKLEVEKRLSYQYPYQEAVLARAKQTVTEIKRQRERVDDYSAQQLIRSKAPIVKRPQFMQQEKTITAAEIGTAMHTVMQHLPLSQSLSESDIAEFVETLVERELLTKDEAQVIDVKAIKAFLDTDLGRILCHAKDVHREVPFNLSLPASHVYPSWSQDSDEKVLVQGVIDCLVQVEDGYVLIDYKTDAIYEDVTDDVVKRLKEKYKIQVNLYKQAVETIWQQPIKEAYLYFFAKELLVRVV